MVGLLRIWVVWVDWVVWVAWVAWVVWVAMADVVGVAARRGLVIGAAGGAVADR
jgi:hypothetical protein